MIYLKLVFSLVAFVIACTMLLFGTAALLGIIFTNPSFDAVCKYRGPLGGLIGGAIIFHKAWSTMREIRKEVSIRKKEQYGDGQNPVV